LRQAPQQVGSASLGLAARTSTAAASSAVEFFLAGAFALAFSLFYFAILLLPIFENVMK
jgi:hypothetical protein